MVTLKVKFGGKGKWHYQRHKTVASARKTRRFIGRLGKVVITSRGRIVR